MTNNNPININADLLAFCCGGTTALGHALWEPIVTGHGRLTSFFDNLDEAMCTMDMNTFSPQDHNYFDKWCQSCGQILLNAQNNYGLWLTDREEETVQILLANFADAEDTDESSNSDSYDSLIPPPENN